MDDRHGVTGGALYLQLFQLWQSPLQVDARDWLARMGEVTSYAQLDLLWPKGSEERTRLFNLLALFECAAVLVQRGLIDEDLFFDAPLGFKSVWSKVRDAVQDWRRASGDPATWENVIWLGQRMEEWDRTRWRSKLPEDDLVRARIARSGRPG